MSRLLKPEGEWKVKRRASAQGGCFASIIAHRKIVATLALLIMSAAAFGQDTFDDSLLLFRSDREGNFELYTMRGDRTNVRRLTFDSATDGRGRFSPDCSKIVFVRDDEDIWIMNADGTDQQFVTSGSWADFTPDGGSLVISAYGGSVYAADNLFTYNLATGARTALPSRTGDEYVSDVSPSGKIAYWHYFFFQVYYANLYTMNLDGTLDTALTFHDDWNKAYARCPRFSPDESRIAYQYASSGYQNIYIMNADGTNSRMLASTEGQGAITPIWSPDGNYVIYADWAHDKSDIYIVGADGTGKQVFYDEPGNNYPLDWISYTALRTEGLPERISLEQDAQHEFTFDVFRGSEGTPASWTIERDAACPWVTSITPTAGVSAGPLERTTVAVHIDAAGLPLGDYAVEFTIHEDVPPQRITIPLRVFNRVNMKDFAGIARHWGAESCPPSQSCYEADLFVDGRIDLADLLQFSMNWLGEGIQRTFLEISEGFESGDFSGLQWQLSGGVNWSVMPETAHEGTFSAKSGAITHRQVSSLSLTVDAETFNQIRFAVKTSSEKSYDSLSFYIDDIEQGKWSGETDWTVQAFSFSQGPHVFRWSYAKDSSLSRGADCAWIDSIEISGQ